MSDRTRRFVQVVPGLLHVPVYRWTYISVDRSVGQVRVRLKTNELNKPNRTGPSGPEGGFKKVGGERKAESLNWRLRPSGVYPCCVLRRFPLYTRRGHSFVSYLYVEKRTRVLLCGSGRVDETQVSTPSLSRGLSFGDSFHSIVVSQPLYIPLPSFSSGEPL